jgi:hypothetical protein
MTGSAQHTSQRVIVCCICAGPIPLETSKIDERGKAVHEECYVRKTIFEIQNSPRSSLPRELAKFDSRAGSNSDSA